MTPNSIKNSGHDTSFSECEDTSRIFQPISATSRFAKATAKFGSRPGKENAVPAVPKIIFEPS